jgi:hypothetical protein
MASAAAAAIDYNQALLLLLALHTAQEQRLQDTCMLSGLRCHALLLWCCQLLLLLLLHAMAVKN